MLKASKMPPGYPEGYTFPKGVDVNVADYEGRGWCFCEASMGTLSKSKFFVFDLCRFIGVRDEDRRCYQCYPDQEMREQDLPCYSLFSQCAWGHSTDAIRYTGSDGKQVNADYDPLERFGGWRNQRVFRAPPLTPACFAERLEEKQFTSKKADLGTVTSLYRVAYEKRLRTAVTLDFSYLGWSDAEVLQLCEGLKFADELKELDLSVNCFGNPAVKALTQALRAGYMPKLETLSVGGEHHGYTQRALYALQRVRPGQIRVSGLEGTGDFYGEDGEVIGQVGYEDGDSEDGWMDDQRRPVSCPQRTRVAVGEDDDDDE